MLDRSVAPGFERICKVDIPRVTSVLSETGFNTHYLEAGNQPVCKIEIIFYSGKSLEELPGASFLTFKMLQEGTRNFTAQQIAEKIDLAGAFLEFEPGVDFSSIQLYCLRTKAKELIPLLFEMINSPVFPESELNKQKQILKQNISIELEKNSVVASRQFRELLFGPRHPHGHSATPDDVDAIKREDVIRFFDDQIKKHPIEVLVSGIADTELLKTISTQLSEVDYPVKPDTDAVGLKIMSDIKRLDLPKESSSQTSIKIGKLAIPKAHPDFIKLLIVSEILGGYFGSRLMQNIREEKGLTYGIYSTLIPIKGNGYFVVSADARKELKESVINEVFAEIEKLRSELIGPDELHMVTNYLSGEFLSSVNTPFNLMDKFKSVHLFGLGYDYYENYFNTLNHITAEEILEISRKHLDPKSMIVVSVG